MCWCVQSSGMCLIVCAPLIHPQMGPCMLVFVVLSADDVAMAVESKCSKQAGVHLFACLLYAMPGSFSELLMV